MLKREITRIILIAIIGMIASLLFFYREDSILLYSLFYMPIYFIGIFYAAKTLLGLLGKASKTYLSYQFMSFHRISLWRVVISTLFLGGAFVAIFIFGWLIGLGKCIYYLITAYKIDQQCLEKTNNRISY